MNNPNIAFGEIALSRVPGRPHPDHRRCGRAERRLARRSAAARTIRPLRPRKGGPRSEEFFGIVAENETFSEFDAAGVLLRQRPRLRVRPLSPARSRKTGRSFETEWVHVFTIRDGQVTRFREHTDTAQFLEGYPRLTGRDCRGLLPGLFNRRGRRMRIFSLIVLSSLLGVSLGAGPGLAQDAGRKADGRRRKTPAPAAAKSRGNLLTACGRRARKKCMDRDGVERMWVEGGNLFVWYENQCRASDIKPIDARSWSMRMSCEGEGEKYSVKPRLLLETPNRLVFADSAAGQPKRKQARGLCAVRREKVAPI